VGVELLLFGKADDGGTVLPEALRGVAEDGAGLDEILHAERRGEFRTAGGGKGVVGTGKVGRDHFFLALQGASLFALNYWLFYIAELHIASGLAAVVFSTIIVWNMLIGAVWIRHPLDRRVLLGAGLGLFGICLVFWPEVAGFEADEYGLYGLVLSVVATILASLGNIASARNQKAGISVMASNAWAMTYGAGLMVLLALVSGKPFGFEATPLYVGALLYLSVFASVIAFWGYLTLVGEIGPDRAAYATLLFPLVALGLSTAFEDYVWTLPAVIGVGFTLGGNLLILKRD